MATPPRIFDQALLDARRRRVVRDAVSGADFLLRVTSDDLVNRLAAVRRHFALAAEVGSPVARLADRLIETGQVDRVVRLDRLAEACPAVVGDAEALPFAPASLDLVISALWLHWVNDLPGVLAQMLRALKPNGLLLAALLGGDTLTELRASLAQAEAEVTGGASPRVAPFAELRAVGALLQRTGFALPVIDQDHHRVRYDSALALMHDLRAMGATNVLVERDRRALRRSVLIRAGEIYAERFTETDGRVTATFTVISLSGWAPHESQQRPLRPGSARARLAEALGAVERSAGEKAGGQEM